MTKIRRAVLWTLAASDRHDINAFDIAVQHGENAAHTYLDGIDAALMVIADNPRIGRSLLRHIPNRHWHVASSGWEIVYDDDENAGRVIVIDVQRGSKTPLR